MGCKTKNHFIRKYKPRVVSCELCLCEAFANILADLWEENSTVPSFMRCVWKRFGGTNRSTVIKPSDLGIPRLKGQFENVRAKLEEAGFDESKLCFPEKTYPNFNDVFRHVGGLFVICYVLGTNLSHAQDLDNDWQHSDEREKLNELLQSIGPREPTAAEQKLIDDLLDRLAETTSENYCNHLGRKLWNAFPYTIFNSRQYIYDLTVQTLCRCEVQDSEDDESSALEQNENIDDNTEPISFEQGRIDNEYDIERTARIRSITGQNEFLTMLKTDNCNRDREKLMWFIMGDDIKSPFSL